jgi:hypothetical protein
MQARWYDPSTSLFTSEDPQMGDAADPSLRSPYAYCADDPVFNSDPTGKGIWFLDLLKNLASASQQPSSKSIFSLFGRRGRGKSGNANKAEVKSASALRLAPVNIASRAQTVSPFGIIQLMGEAKRNRDLMNYLEETEKLGSEEMRIKVWREMRKRTDLFYSEFEYTASSESSTGTLTMNVYTNFFYHSSISTSWAAKSGLKGLSESTPKGPIPSGAYAIVAKQTSNIKASFGRFAYQLKAATQNTIDFLNYKNRTLSYKSAKEDIGNFLIHEDFGAEGTAGCVGIKKEQNVPFDQIASFLGIPGAPPNPGSSNPLYQAIRGSNQPVYLFVNYPEEDYVRPYD